MKRIIVLIFLLSASFTFAQNQATAGYRNIMKLLAEKDFFSARDYVRQNKSDFAKHEALIIRSYLENAFNNPRESNNNLTIIFENFSTRLGDSLTLDLLRLQQENYGRMYEYKQAGKTTEKILNDHKSIMKPEEIADFRNMQVILSTLSGQPKQEVTIDGMSEIRMSRDKANLTNLPVMSANTTVDFIFDTGANLSTVTQSTAQKLGLKILEGERIEVGAITGAKVMAQLAICPEFRFGNITVRNAVFIVFPDEALAFPQIDYQINGILGFPVIEALKEVQITQADIFIVPEQLTAYENANMALDFLTPLIRINGEHFTFDTGATGTSLYKKYFDKHRKDIEGKFKLSQLNLGGAGGMETMKGYHASFTPVIEGKAVQLEPVDILIENVDDEDHKFYGNIGQDLIKQFQKMTINFERMFIKFD